MRFVRIPYKYLPDGFLTWLRSKSFSLLIIISDIHNNRPNNKWRIPGVSDLLYHPSFLCWVHIKANQELRSRGKKVKLLLSEEMKSLRSKPLSDLIPPSDAEIAEDIVWFFESRAFHFKGGQKFPLFYLRLANKYYDYVPNEAAQARIDETAGYNCDIERRWYSYSCQDEKGIN